MWLMGSKASCKKKLGFARGSGARSPDMSALPLTTCMATGNLLNIPRLQRPLLHGFFYIMEITIAPRPQRAAGRRTVKDVGEHLPSS